MSNRADLVCRRLQDSVDVKQALRAEVPSIVEVAEALLAALRAGGKALFFGNGGGAANPPPPPPQPLGRFPPPRPPPPPPPPPRAHPAAPAIANHHDVATGRPQTFLLAACLLASLLQSIFFAYALVTDADEGAYMALGRLAIAGKIGLFLDEMTGQRMPLPYYFIGLSQVVFGRSLLAARLSSAALGLACLVLVYLLGRRLGGEIAGVLALLFAAPQSVIIRYFAGAYYHSLVSLQLLVALYLLLATEVRHRRVMAMGCVALLFFTRPNVAPLIPLACAYLLWQSERRGARLAIVALALPPPAPVP